MLLLPSGLSVPIDSQPRQCTHTACHHCNWIWLSSFYFLFTLRLPACHNICGAFNTFKAVSSEQKNETASLWCNRITVSIGGQYFTFWQADFRKCTQIYPTAFYSSSWTLARSSSSRFWWRNIQMLWRSLDWSHLYWSALGVEGMGGGGAD